MAGAISKRSSSNIRQRTTSGDLAASELDASNAIEVIRFGTVVEKITYVINGDLTGTIEFSLNGKDWTAPLPLPAANTLVTHDTHLITSIRLTRATNSGTVTIAVI